jgi:hypothetical protein
VAHYHRWRLVHSADELTAEIVAKRFVALGAAGFVDHASELDERAVAGALNDTPAMHGDSWVDQIAALARNRASVGSSSAPGCIRRYPQPESPLSSGSRSWRTLPGIVRH